MSSEIARRAKKNKEPAGGSLPCDARPRGAHHFEEDIYAYSIAAKMTSRMHSAVST